MRAFRCPFALFVLNTCLVLVKKHLRALLLPEGVLNPSLKVAVPLYAQTPTLAVLAPVLEDLIGLLGPHFKSLQSWQGRHDLLATADPSKWHQNHWTDAIGKATMLRLLDSTTPVDHVSLSRPVAAAQHGCQ